MSTPYWDVERASFWDVVWLGNTMLPGIVKDVVPNFQNVISEGETQGTKGASSTHKGMNPRSLTVKLQIATEDALSEWDTVIKILNIFGSDAVTRPFTVVHPVAQQYGIRTVWIESCTQTHPNPKDGIFVTIKLKEKIEPVGNKNKKKVEKPKQAWGDVGFPPTPSNNLA